MVDISKVSGQTPSAPPIILQLVDNKPNDMYGAVNLNEKPDSFEKKKEDKQPTTADPNDKFVNTNEQPKAFSEQKLGAKYSPKEVKKFGEEALKWGKRVWAGLEFYDTVDGYRERLSKDDDTKAQA